MKSGIYKITNKATGKSYIGQSDDCERRIKEHKQKRNLTIDDWINFLGCDAFDFEIIEYCDQTELDSKEQYYIKKYNSQNNGYNIQAGGYNNCQGESNGRAKITADEIVQIRTAYKNHCSPKKEYQKYADKITLSQFQGIWQGRSWVTIMPEVYTEENKQYYKNGLQGKTLAFTPEEVLKYRKEYVNHTLTEVYKKMCEDKGENYIKERTFSKIIMGDVKNSSPYKDVPIYKKREKIWIKN